VSDETTEGPDPSTTLAELNTLVARARAGDVEVLPQLRKVLDEHPEVWHCGDVAMIARDSWITLIAGPDLALKELLDRRARELKDELAGPHPTPLEGLLVDRIVACWLAVHHAEASIAQSGDMSLRLAEYAQKRLNSAQRRYLMAIGALASVRKLLPTTIEVTAHRDDEPGPKLPRCRVG
jgi:hypothetical protein